MDARRLALDATPETAKTIAAVSVNPPVLARLREALPTLSVVGEELEPGIDVSYDSCGLDRVMGVVGALHLRPEASGVILLDVGTCLTATLGLRSEGVVGGAIAPGVDLMARALAEGTQTLPAIDPLASVEPPGALGRSTEDSIRAGVHAALVGAARELVRRIRGQSQHALDVVATGTGAHSLAEVADAVHPHATLWGVYLAGSR